ncbi:recombinase family protein [Geothrix oryzisoli]|uniref:recombinase family protein n=1 Tax=Geothrix oryzisoli TaxID=2922721 RepID=UPI001FAB67D1|nr:recombinase family protein [Geothrix oryzisoli]
MSDDLIQAAQYVRMSTEHQQYSTENQSDVLRDYANRRGIQIVRTFSDAGKSGLRLDGRDGLKELIETVQCGRANFTMVLVYDVSRWGRFQDADESAYYEYICKRAGITVQYCAEQFENDGSPVSTIVKGVKRAMAGEYSRELSTKVFKGQCRLIELGFRQGGAAGYGLRRLLIDQAGKPKAELQPGEQKSLQTDRVVLVPGPPEERAVVRRIYRLFVEEGYTERQIAGELNRAGIFGELGRNWTRGMIHQVLTNEKYVGNNVYNKISFKLKKKRVKNPPQMWVRRNGAFDAVVDLVDFTAAQEIILERHKRSSDTELLEMLRGLAQRHGRLSGLIIDEAEGMPSSSAYRQRFGSLARAYQLIDYLPDRDFAYVEINRRLRQLHPEIMVQVIKALEDHGGTVTRDSETDLLLVNGMHSVAIVIARCQVSRADALRWIVRLDAGLAPDLTLVVRMDSANLAPFDYYLLPSLDVKEARLRIKEDNGLFMDGYRYESLEYFLGIAQTVRAGAAA